MKTNKVTVITGASRGIGKAIAIKLANEGHNLALFARNKKLLKEIKNEICSENIDVIVFAGDVTDKEYVKKSIDKVLKKYGRIDNLINNAGIMIIKKLIDSEFTEFYNQINTNLFAVYHFTKAVLPKMIEHRGGNIINISSLAGKNSFVGGTMYAASKHALQGFSKSLMLEVREYNIRVSLVCPGSVNTDLLVNSAMKPKDQAKILDISDIADTISAIINLPTRALISEVEIRPTNP